MGEGMITTEGLIALYRSALRRHWKNRDLGLVFDDEQEPDPEMIGLDAETAQLVRNHELNLYNNEPKTV